MALARIITRSDTCSRELAFDLLGRGYAVEIVTPDTIPSHRADLELRVETGAGDRLTASVIARDGERSASLEFVRQLKAPISDTVPAAAALEMNLAAASTSADAESSLKSLDLPAEANVAASVVRPIEIMLTPESEATRQIRQYSVPEIKPESKEDIEAVKDALQPIEASAREAMPNPLPLQAEEPLGNFASASSMIMRPTIMRPTVEAAALRGRVQPVAKRLWDVRPVLATTIPKAQPPAVSCPVQASAEAPNNVHVEPLVKPDDSESENFGSQSYEHHSYERSAGPLLTIAVTLTSMALLLTLVFGLSMRGTSSPVPAVGDKVASPSGAGTSAAPRTNLPGAVVPTADSGNRPARISPLPASTPAPRPEAQPAPAAKASSITKVKHAARKPARAPALAKNSHVHGDQLIARDTVTYLDRPKAAVPQKSFVGLNANDRRAGVIAENTVTNLNGSSGNPIQPAPKEAK